MDLAKLHQKLIAAARANRPSEQVPYAFEKRVMARLKAVSTLDHWALWARALWRGAAACVVLTLLLGAWSFVASPPEPSGPDLSQDFENTLLAAADQEQSADTTW